jgi:hypothetical protein
MNVSDTPVPVARPTRMAASGSFSPATSAAAIEQDQRQRPLDGHQRAAHACLLSADPEAVCAGREEQIEADGHRRGGQGEHAEKNCRPHQRLMAADEPARDGHRGDDDRETHLVELPPEQRAVRRRAVCGFGHQLQSREGTGELHG